METLLPHSAWNTRIILVQYPCKPELGGGDLFKDKVTALSVPSQATSEKTPDQSYSWCTVSCRADCVKGKMTKQEPRH